MSYHQTKKLNIKLSCVNYHDLKTTLLAVKTQLYLLLSFFGYLLFFGLPLRL